MSDDDIRALARRWRGPVRRGDCSVTYARQECVGEVVYPHADSTRYAHIKQIVDSELT